MKVSSRGRALFLCCVGFALLTASAGCGDDSGAGDGGGGGGDACESGVTVTGVVKEFETKVERQQFEPVPGVKVCVYEHDEVPCATTSASGTYELCGVPEESELLISFEKKDYAKALRMLTTRQEDYDILAETTISTLALGIAQAQQHGVDLTQVDGGVVQFFAAEPGDGVLQVALLEGFAAELLDENDEPAMCIGADGDVPCIPLYLDEDGEPDNTLTSSSRKGVGAFGNVKPGKYHLRISHPDLTCTEHLPEAGWRAEEDDQVVVEVIDEWITSQVGVFCQPE